MKVIVEKSGYKQSESIVTRHSFNDDCVNKENEILNVVGDTEYKFNTKLLEVISQIKQLKDKLEFDIRYCHHRIKELNEFLDGLREEYHFNI